MLFVDLCGFAALHGKWSFIIAIIAKNHFSQLSYLRGAIDSKSVGEHGPECRNDNCVRTGWLFFLHGVGILHRGFDFPSPRLQPFQNGCEPSS